MGVYKMLVLNCQKMLEINCHFLLESTCRLQMIPDIGAHSHVIMCSFNNLGEVKNEY